MGIDSEKYLSLLGQTIEQSGISTFSRVRVQKILQITPDKAERLIQGWLSTKTVIRVECGLYEAV